MGSCTDGVTVSTTGTAKYLRHGIYLKLLFRLDPYFYQDEILTLHLSVTLEVFSKVLIIVNIYVRSLSLYTWATSSVELLLWLQ